ncbi:MAG: hypothetical protein ACI8QS_001197 [Planctomycetota bacterium]|jgi:hypothetical protein
MSLNSLIFGISSLILGGVLILSNATVRLPANNQGYAPEQPIEFSHRLHAGELAIDCQYCHFGARRSRNAGVPPASVCMNCHRSVTSSFDALLEEKIRAETQGRDPETIVSAELRKLYDALALDENLEPIEGTKPTSIEWVRVHNLPDFVYFDHRPHVAQDVACESCHGPVQSMERMRQESTLSMGWCLDCHRSSVSWQHDGPIDGAPKPGEHVSTNCVTCHL